MNASIKKLAPLTALTLALISLIICGFLQNHVSAACSAPGTNYGSASQTITIDTTGVYYIWERINAPDSTNNSFFLEIDGNSCFVVGDANITSNSWTWVNYQNGSSISRISLSLNQGNHSFKYIGREPGVKLDRVLLLSDASCTPTGKGDNCVNVTTPIVPPPPSAGSGSTGSSSSGVTPSVPVSGSVTIAPSGSGSKTIIKVDGKTVGNKIDTTTLNNGAHTIQTTKISTDGTVTTTEQKIYVKNNLNIIEKMRNMLLKPWAGHSGRSLNLIFGSVPIGTTAAGIGVWQFALWQRRQRWLGVHGFSTIQQLGGSGHPAPTMETKIIHPTVDNQEYKIDKNELTVHDKRK